MTPLSRQSTARIWSARYSPSRSAHLPLTSNVSVRSFAQTAAAQHSSPSSSSSSHSSHSSPSVTASSVSRTATLPNSQLWRFRPTHRRFPLSNRHNPTTPLTFQPITQPPTPHTPPTHPTPVPFSLSRTRSHALPVYLDYRGGGTLVTTCVRRVEGDVEAMARQLQLLVGERTRVVVRPGRVEVKGNYVEETKRWLEKIGF